MTESASPIVWCLLAGRAGDDAQILALARALGWTIVCKRLHFNRKKSWPNLLLGASVASLDRSRSDPLTPPWPDVVIASARHSAPVSLWIKKRSGGCTRLVHLQYAEAPLEKFDLVVTMPHFCLPKRANVLEVPAPLNRPDATRMAEATRRWQDRIEALSSPRTAVLVGGSNSVFGLDESVAQRLGRAASDHARAVGGSLLVTTSPRTPAAAVSALEGAIDAPALFYRWRRDDPENPYPAYLALADDFIVTADSSSLIAEACALGKPVQLFEAPPFPTSRPTFRSLGRRAGRIADRFPAGRRAFRWAVEKGLVNSPRDFAALHRGLRERGLLRRLGENTGSEPPIPLEHIEEAAARIRALVE